MNSTLLKRSSQEFEIDTTVAGSPCNFSAVGVTLSNIDRIPMIVKHMRWPWPADSINLFNRDIEARSDGAQVFIQVYPLPDGAKEFRDGLALYRENKKGFLVEGRRFSPSLLLPRFSPAGFELESFQVRDGSHRRRIVHVFSATHRAIILVYSLNSAHFASSVFFRQVSESLDIGEK
ncbi:MAG: hypothetical protein ABI144_11655 [Gallionella sp.]